MASVQFAYADDSQGDQGKKGESDAMRNLQWYALPGSKPDTGSFINTLLPESVGSPVSSILAAFLIVPSATAYLLTDRLPLMLGLTALFGVLSSVLGYSLAVMTNGSVAGAMAVASGIWFLVALLIQRVFLKPVRKTAISALCSRL